MSAPRVYQSPKGPIEIVPYAPGDEVGLRELFAAVFKRERSPEEWNWLFRDCPDGFHCFLGRTEEGRIVSQFCAIPARLRIRGRTWTVGQIVDSMVHPEYRAGLKRKGLFACTVDAMVEEYGRPDRELLMLGLPNRPAFRIGRKLCGYVPMQKVHVQTKTIRPDPKVPCVPEEASWKGDRFRLQKVNRFSPDVDLLWDRMAGRFEAIAARDRLRLDWRYGACPDPERYHILEIRTGDGLLAGYAVGVFGYEERPVGIIADWFVDSEVRGAAPALLRVVEDLMAQVSMEWVKVLLNPMSDEARFFEDMGYDLTTTHYHLVSRTYAPEIVTPGWLNRSWYYTLGDFDVV